MYFSFVEEVYNDLLTLQLNIPQSYQIQFLCTHWNKVYNMVDSFKKMYMYVNKHPWKNRVLCLKIFIYR
jgi:hypothetical protein